MAVRALSGDGAKRRRRFHLLQCVASAACEGVGAGGGGGGCAPQVQGAELAGEEADAQHPH